jgi:hypothetical protein
MNLSKKFYNDNWENRDEVWDNSTFSSNSIENEFIATSEIGRFVLPSRKKGVRRIRDWHTGRCDYRGGYWFRVRRRARGLVCTNSGKLSPGGALGYDIDTLLGLTYMICAICGTPSPPFISHLNLSTKGTPFALSINVKI